MPKTLTWWLGGGYHLPNHVWAFLPVCTDARRVASPQGNVPLGRALSDSLGDEQLTESTDRPTSSEPSEADMPGVTTQVPRIDVGWAEALAAAYEEPLKDF